MPRPGKSEEDDEDLNEKRRVPKDLHIDGSDEIEDSKSRSPGDRSKDSDWQSDENGEERDLHGEEDPFQEQGKILDDNGGI